MAADTVSKISTCYREIVITTQNWTRWKEITVNTGGSASTLQDIKVPDSAGGFTYDSSGCLGSAVSNRFIYWRSVGDTLELIEESLDHDLSNNHLRLRFLDTSIVGGVGVFESRGNVILLVATVTSVHRILFPHPTKIHREDQRSTDRATLPSIFTDASLAGIHSPHNSHVITTTTYLPSHAQSATTWLTHDGEAVFVYATNVGSVLVVKLPPPEIRGVVTQQEIAQSSVMHRIWTGIVPAAIRGGQEATHTPLSLCLFSLNTTTFISAICRDHKLRLWTLLNYECVMVNDVLDTIGATVNKNNPTGSGHVIKTTLDSDRQGVKLAVYLNLGEYSQVALLEPVVVNGRYQLSHLTSCFTDSDDLVDFCVTSTQIWLLSNDKSGHPIVKSAHYESSGITHPWTPVCLQPPPIADLPAPTHHDPRDFYISLIFHPGHFTSHDIHKALLNFCKSLDSQHSTVDLTIDQLKEKVSAAVETEIQNCVGGSEVPEEEYYHLQLSQWAAFYSRCIQYSKIGTKPKGIIADDKTGMACIIKKGSISYLGACDTIDQLYSHDTQDDSIPGLHPDTYKVVQCLRDLSANIPDEISEEIDDALLYLEPPDLVIERVLEEVIYSERQPVDVQGVTEGINNCLHAVTDIPAAISSLLSLLDLANTYDGFMPQDDMETGNTEFNRLLSSELGCQIVTVQLSHLLQCRFTVCRDLLLLQKAAVLLSQHIGLSEESLISLQSHLIPQTVKLTRAYFALKTINEQLVSTPPNSLESHLRQLSALDLRDTASLVHASDYTKNQTITNLFISTIGGTESRRLLATDGHTDVRLWSGTLLTHTLNVAKLLWPISDNFLFPEFLLGQSQFLCIEAYVRLLHDWCDCNGASRMFLLAQAYLSSNEPYKAADCFKLAKSGVMDEEFLYQRLIHTDEDDQYRVQVLYYLKVIDLYEQTHTYDVIVTLANAALTIAQSDDPNVPKLWSKVFKYQLKLGHYDEAYVAMTSNPDRDRRKDCLREFVVVLCEKHQLEVLTQFPYIDLHDDVVDALVTKARAVDLSVQNFYDLLYAFHISRSNYRTAGSVMYEYGMRLGQELPTLDGLQRQAKCYLTALNALRLVNPNYAWVIKPTQACRKQVDQNSSMISKRFADGEEKTQSQRKIEIVELPDIEREYLLVNARLKLLHRDNSQSLYSSGLSVGGGQDIVGQLVNAGLFDTAIVVSRAFSLPLSPILDGLAMRCVTLSQQSTIAKGDNTYTTRAWEWLSENVVGSNFVAKEASSCVDLAWHLLQTYLDTYEDTSVRLHHSIALKLLSHGFPLPAWFILSYKKRNAADLLHLYLSHDLLAEAVTLAVEYVDAVWDVTRGQDRDMFGLVGTISPHSQSVWLPYTYIDQLLIALDTLSNDYSYQTMANTLRTKLTTYQTHLEELQKMMLLPQEVM